MNISTTVPTTTEITRRRMAGVIVGVAAATAALTWALTAVAIDTTPEPTRTTPTTIQHAALGNPLGVSFTPAAGQVVAADARPIVVADAYHGVGVTVCPHRQEPVNIADGYHGVGVTVCV